MFHLIHILQSVELDWPPFIDPVNKEEISAQLPPEPVAKNGDCDNEDESKKCDRTEFKLEYGENISVNEIT